MEELNRGSMLGTSPQNDTEKDKEEVTLLQNYVNLSLTRLEEAKEKFDVWRENKLVVDEVLYKEITSMIEVYKNEDMSLAERILKAGTLSKYSQYGQKVPKLDMARKRHGKAR